MKQILTRYFSQNKANNSRNSFKLCQYESFLNKCCSILSGILSTFLPGFEYNGEKEFSYADAENKNLCNCLPGCETNYYDIETSKTILSRIHANNYNQF